MRRSFHQAVREITVIGQQKETFAGVIETSDRIYARPDASHQIHNRGPAFRITQRGDVSFRLVHQQINVSFGAVQQFSVYANMIALDVSFGSELGDDLSVHRYGAGSDQLLGVAPGGNPSSGNDFLQTLGRHVWKR